MPWNLEKRWKYLIYILAIPIAAIIDWFAVHSGFAFSVRPWYHYGGVLIVIALCSVLWWKTNRSAIRNIFYAIFYWSVILLVFEDILYIGYYGITLWHYPWPINYTWMPEVYGGWIEPLIQSWLFDLPTFYWVAFGWLGFLHCEKTAFTPSQ